jgi:hypothetical protein
MANQRGEWMGDDKILLEGDVFSNRTNTANRKTSLTQTTQVCKDHIVPKVLLTVGTNNTTNLSATHTSSEKLHNLLLVLHRSNRWLLSVRPVDCAGQTGAHSGCTRMFQEASITPLSPGTKTTLKTQTLGKLEASQNLSTQHQTCQELIKSTIEQSCTRLAIHPRQNPQGTCTGQTSQAWAALDEQRATGPNNIPYVQIRSMNLHETLGILVVPHGHPIATIWSPKTR